MPLSEEWDLVDAVALPGQATEAAIELATALQRMSIYMDADQALACRDTATKGNKSGLASWASPRHGYLTTADHHQYHALPAPTFRLRSQRAGGNIGQGLVCRRRI